MNKKEMKKELTELSTEIKDAREMVKKWNKVINTAEEKKSEIYKDIIKKCKHPEKSIRILQFEYDSSGDSDHVPEKRVCSLCGYAEIGKTTGYQGEYEFRRLKCKEVRGVNGNCINEKEYEKMQKWQFDLEYRLAWLDN